MSITALQAERPLPVLATALAARIVPLFTA